MEISERDKFYKFDKYYLIYIIMVGTLIIKEIVINTMVERVAIETKIVDVSSSEHVMEKSAKVLSNFFFKYVIEM